MRNMLTIFRREFATYFNSPIGYVFVIPFLFFNSVLFVSAFFLNPVASMRPMFYLLPAQLCALIPIISMRLWAEDRKDNTIEMLLTFPMKAYELVLGKYFAGFAFFIVVLLGTATIPFMLGQLGNPDWGVIWTSYIGILFVGAVFLALGAFLSSLVRDQIIAAILSVAGCAILVLFGTDFMAISLDSWWSGLGTEIQAVVGITPRYYPFMRGIVEITNICYFMIWIVLFLFLNGLFLEGRNRPGARMFFSTAVVICLIIGVLFNSLISGMSLGRFDCTENKIYTTSDATSKILKKLQVPVKINYYVTVRSQMPTEFKNTEQDVLGKLEEMKVASGGKLQYKAIHLKVENLVRRSVQLQQKKDNKKSSQEEILFNKGVKPFSIQTFKSDKQSTQLVYSCIGIGYKDKPEELLPRVTSIYNLEYDIISAVHRLSRPKKPIIVVVAPKDEVPPHIAQLMMQMRRPVPPPRDPYKPLEHILKKEGFEVKRVSISKKQPLPKEYDVLIVINPKNFSDRQKWEIARALRSGKNVLLAVQNYSFDYNVNRGRMSISKQEQKPNVNDWLKSYGISVDPDYLMDENSVALTIATSDNPLERMFGGGMQVNLPMHVVITSNNMASNVSITNKLSELPYLWGTALKINKEKIKERKLEHTVLFTSGKNSWKVPASRNLSDSDLKLPLDPANRSKYPLMVMLKGQFPDAYSGKDRPKWPKPKPTRPGFPPPPADNSPEPAVQKIEPKPATLMVIGCSYIFRQEFVSNSIVFFKNCVDTLALGEELINIRSRRIITRRIPLPENRDWWKILNYCLMPMLFLLFGISRMTMRRVKRDRYTMEMMTS